MANILINHGANPNQARNDGSAPLHDASALGHSDVVQTLIKGGANVNGVDKTQAVALHYAVEEKHRNVIPELL